MCVCVPKLVFNLRYMSCTSRHFVGVGADWSKVPRRTNEDNWNSLMVRINWKLLIFHSICMLFIIICFILFQLCRCISTSCTNIISMSLNRKHSKKWAPSLGTTNTKPKKDLRLRKNTPVSVKASTQNMDDYNPEDFNRALVNWCDPYEMVCDIVY